MSLLQRGHITVFWPRLSIGSEVPNYGERYSSSAPGSIIRLGDFEETPKFKTSNLRGGTIRMSQATNRLVLTSDLKTPLILL
jgi:hypothetical protein